MRHVTSSANANIESLCSIAGLAGGGYVVAWRNWGPAIPEVRFRRFDANGNALDGTDTEGVLIDDFGNSYSYPGRRLAGRGLRRRLPGRRLARRQRRRHHGASLQRGRNGAQLTVAGQLRPASPSQQFAPRLTVMDDGHFVVSWGSDTDQRFQVYDAAGEKLGSNATMASNVAAGDLAALDGSAIAQVWQSLDTDGSGTSIKTAQVEFVRVITGDGTSETITGSAMGSRKFCSGTAVSTRSRAGAVTTRSTAAPAMTTSTEGRETTPRYSPTPSTTTPSTMSAARSLVEGFEETRRALRHRASAIRRRHAGRRRRRQRAVRRALLPQPQSRRVPGRRRSARSTTT